MSDKFTNKTMFLIAAAMAYLSAPAIAADQDAIAKGHQEFQARCQHCHGENADGQGSAVGFLHIKPANLTVLARGADNSCVTDRVLKAVLGRHPAGDEGKAKMPLLKDALTAEEVYFVAEYIKSIQQ